MEEKIIRLQEIIAEAHQLINDIEQEIKKYSAKEYQDISIEAINMPNKSHKTRIMNALRAYNILTIGDLLKHSTREIKVLRNSGKIVVSELQETLFKQYKITWY